MKPDETKPEEVRQLTKSEVEKIIGEPVVEYSVSAGSNKGDNVAGNLLAIKATTVASPSKTLNLIYKSFPDDMSPEQRKFLVDFGSFRVETCVYEILIPRLEEILQKQSKAENKRLPTVKYISGLNNDENDYLCMEDVRHQGYIMQNKYQTLSVGEVTLVMKELARFHALTYFLLRYDGERMLEENERLRRFKYNVFSVETPFMAMMAKMFLNHMENVVELLQPRSQELSDRVKNFISKNDTNSYYKIQKFRTALTDSRIFPCLIHGDLWTNNILFKYDDKGNREAPTDVKFIDFQQTRRGNILEDLGYFFWCSTTPEFRKHHLTSMLEIYYDSFEETMKQLEWPKPIGFTKGFLLDIFHEGILSAYVYMPFALSLQMGDLTYMMGKTVDGEDPPEKKEGDEPQLPDFDKMAEDDKKLMMLRMVNSPKAVDRLEDLTREIVELDLLK